MTVVCRAENVLMVLGGQYFNASSRLYDVVAQVEVVGPRGSCQLPPLPSPLYALTATRVGETVVACGGFHYYYRARAGYSYKSTWGCRRMRSPSLRL